ncbi:unnamed protein product [Vitrella brassicaformis CCMP3155]|uniref:Uncharacterized protein n=1 Tax=Vitrella brassicaformis (strain CCMP3155) TaxID=1169540 RepID=A0A0G4F9T2_VITBC|nr:unnamed protein product [Vitrella brassicaformis CCMP3155]|eukprot:CEM09638.1 unnamed protein product [Vitrella brassicaformis CCMP3155]
MTGMTDASLVHRLEQTILGIQSLLEGVWLCVTDGDVRREYLFCWKWIGGFLVVTIVISQVMVLPLAILFHLVDFITLESYDISKYTSALAARMARLMVDIVPSLCLAFLGYPLERAFFAVLASVSPTDHSTLSAMTRLPRDPFQFLWRLMRRLARGALFSLLLGLLYGLPIKGVYAVVVLVMEVVLATTFTGPYAALVAFLIAFFFPQAKPLTLRLLNIFHVATLSSADFLDPYLARHYSNDQKSYRRQKRFLRENQGLVMPFGMVFVALGAVRGVGPLMCLVSVPASAALVPHLRRGDDE